MEVADRSQTPPPPRYPTNWTVRKADSEEVRSYREQERRRYDNPHKAFTYRSNGYESVVGPLKGIYNPSMGNTKARGHTMLSADRPNFVTILSLVRDATARLPNGEGTRAEICELLKSSQYISNTAPDNVLQSVVSGALDRMHTQFDPCVKYDPKRKIWIYLHRNRSEEDFERLHQQYQGMNKGIKKANKTKSPVKHKIKSDKLVKCKSDLSTDKIKAFQKIKADASLSPNISSSSQGATISSRDLNSPSSSKAGTSLLPQITKLNKIDSSSDSSQLSQSPQHIATVKIPSKHSPTSEEKEINDALQAIVQSGGTKSIVNTKSGKSLVKIITSGQGKSLLIPSSIQTGKHDQKHIKQISQTNVTQQLLQTIAAQQKQLNIQQPIRIELSEKSSDHKLTNKLPLSLQQQIVQPVAHIQNIKLVRNLTQRQSPQTITSGQTQTNAVTQYTVTNQSSQGNMSVNKINEQTNQQIRIQQSVTSHQHHLLQSLKQKVLPVQSTMLSGQQLFVKQKGVTQIPKQMQQTSSGTSLLGQNRITSGKNRQCHIFREQIHSFLDGMQTKQLITSSQTPLVAKLLTNAAGQVISVESILAHQKQHGSMPQGIVCWVFLITYVIHR